MRDAQDFTHKLENATENIPVVRLRVQTQKGSHHILIHPRAKRAIVIPEYDEVDTEIIKANMRTVGMTRDEYFELLKQV